jgi:hypothetical protein
MPVVLYLWSEFNDLTLFSRPSMPIFIRKVKIKVPHVEQELLSARDYQVFDGVRVARSLYVCVIYNVYV